MKVSNPEKVMFPDAGLTKGDVVDHYRRVADVMLPFLAGRPLTLERYPNGIGEKGFMQKNAARHFPASIGRVEVPKSDGTVTHPVVGSVEGLLYLANQGTITFHVWTGRLPSIDKPTHLVLDLDPSTESDVDKVRRVAEVSRRELGEFGLDTQLVASGSKGFHLWAPLVADVDCDVVGRAAWLLAALVAHRLPDLATVEFLKRERRGRVFVDWLRNHRAQSIVSPYSLRARAAAPVVTPLRWGELGDAEPSGWTLRTLGSRVEDPPSQPSPARLDMESLERAAGIAGIAPDPDIDRFGRRSSPPDDASHRRPP